MTAGASHAEFRLLAAAAVDGRIDAAAADALEAHLVGCKPCRVLQAQLLRDHRWLSEPGSHGEPPARIRAVVLEAARAPRRPRQDRTTWALLAAAGLVIAVAGFASLRLRLEAGVGLVPDPTPAASPLPTGNSSPGPTPATSEVPPWAKGTGIVSGKEGLTATFPFQASVRGEGATGTGTLQFADPDGTEWSGTVHWLEYWWDAGGQWYVAFMEGCRKTEVDGECRTFVMQLVDGRERADRNDEVSLSWATRDNYDGQGWQFWYGVTNGDVEVAQPIDVRP